MDRTEEEKKKAFIESLKTIYRIDEKAARKKGMTIDEMIKMYNPDIVNLALEMWEEEESLRKGLYK